MRGAVERSLPGIPFAFLADLGSEDPSAVEAVLLGSLAREASRWDPRGYPRLRFVQRIFTGVDDLPFDRFPTRVEIAGNVGGYAPFVAEHAVALALGSARCLLEGSAMVAAGRSRPPPELRSLHRETAVILGYGAIGRALAERLRPFGARVVGLNRSGLPAPGADAMFPAARLREAVAGAGFVFEARPLTAVTRGTLGAPEFRAMREDATFVNVGRGATVDAEALYHHLLEHSRFRAALDVWWNEDFVEGRLPSPFPFAGLPNFLGSPHWAGFAPRAAEHALTTALENLARFFRGERPAHIVDRAEYVRGPVRGA
jgi:phosphoglycerate dehydrogenase-like enzyme